MAQPADPFAAFDSLLPEKSDSAAEVERKRAELVRVLAALPDHPLAWREDFRALVRQVEAAIGQAEIDWAGLVIQRTKD